MPRAPHARSGCYRLAASLLALGLATLTIDGLGYVDPTAAAAEDEFPLTLDSGHVDAFTLLQSAGALGLQLQEDVSGHHVLHQPEDVLLRVKEEARTTLPDPVPGNLSFLGAAGDDVYFLPQTQDPDLIWPGWSTERMPTGAFTDPLRILVEAVDGPGEVYLWQTGSFGQSTSVLDGGGHRLPGTISVNANSHVHANWGFTEAGRYRLTVAASGTRTDGSTVVTEPTTYTFDVGDASTSPDPTPTPTPDPSPDPTPTPTQTPPPAPDTDPIPDGVWDVSNGTVNSQGATILNAGHVDVASTLEGGVLDTKVKDTTESSTPTWRDPAATILQLLPSSRTTVPSNPAYSFLGPAGAPFYQVSQTQQPALLWPGWSTENVPADATTGGVLWALTDMSGPGTFAVYETDPFGRPLILFDTSDGVGAADRFTIAKNTHAHGSWAFSQQGTYCLSMQRVAELPGGRTVSDAFVLAVAVGRADVMSLDPARCGEQVRTEPVKIKPPKPDKPDKDKNQDNDAGASSDDGSDTASGTDPSTGGEAGQAGNDDRCVVAPVAAPTTPDVPAATVLSAGHVDYASRIVDGELVSQVGDDTSGSKVYREPSSTVLWLRPASRVTLPPGYGEVGAAGTTVWQVPQTQDPELIWLGWNTELLNAGNARGQVSWRLDRVEGPGTVKVYLSGSFGGVQTMVLSGPGSSYGIDLGVHAHGNWAFSEEGVYRLTTTQSVTLANGERSSDTEVLTIAVGDVDPSSVAGPTTGPDAVATSLSTAGSGCAGSAPPTSAPGAAAPAVAAPAAVTVPVADQGFGVTTGTEPVQPAIAPAAARTERIPLLVGVLGGLLLLGAAGTGALWWRRTAVISDGRAIG